LSNLGQMSERSMALEYSGTIEATESRLSLQVAGLVINVLVDEGQSVDKDQTLAVLDRSEYQARYDQVRDNLEATKRKLLYTDQLLMRPC
jgi:HlyD family secretion protein